MRTKSLGDLLADTPWVRSLPNSVRERVMADAYETYHDPKDVVARKGDVAQSWMGVAEGFVKASAVVRSGKVVMFSGLPAGAWFGEGSVIRRTIRQYDIIAMRRSRVLHIPRATFRWLLETNIDFNHFIIDHLNARLAQFMAMTETDRMTDPVVKVARAISGLFDPIIYPGLGVPGRVGRTRRPDASKRECSRQSIAGSGPGTGGVRRPVDHAARCAAQPQGALVSAPGHGAFA